MRVAGLRRISIGAYELVDGDRRAIIRRQGRQGFRLELCEGNVGKLLHPKFATLAAAVVAARFYFDDIEGQTFFANLSLSLVTHAAYAVEAVADRSVVSQARAAFYQALRGWKLFRE